MKVKKEVICLPMYADLSENNEVKIEEKIQEISKVKNYNLEYLKTSKFPVVLYGTAQLGNIVKHLLDANGIKINYVVVDKEYWQPNRKFYDFDVLKSEEVLYNGLDLNVVVTFSSGKYMEKISQLNELENVQRCIYFDTFKILDFGFDFDFIHKNSSVLINLYNCLADDLSRETMLEFMKAKNLMNARELMKLNVPDEEQYFPNFLPISENEIFVDCGAYTGDTIEIFLQKVNNKFNKIFAFEPDASNIEKCKEMITKFGEKSIVLFEKGAWKEKEILYFDSRGNSGSTVSEDGNKKIEVDSIDNVCGYEKVSFIKMDIEGSELEALEGAKETIIKNKPKLAICVYHKQEDLITIPQYILSLNPEYKLYLRHYGCFCTEFVLYAI